MDGAVLLPIFFTTGDPTVLPVQAGDVPPYILLTKAHYYSF